MITSNESSADRDIRAAVGAVLMFLAVFIIPSPWNFLLGAVALVMFATAAAGFCPLYAIFGYSTRSADAGRRRR